MSRTYRKLPRWASKVALAGEYAAGFFGHHNRLDNCVSERDFIRISTAIRRGERGSGWQGLNARVDPESGKPVGFGDDLPRGRKNKRQPHKARRCADKVMIVDAVNQMIQDVIDSYNEALDLEMLEQDDYDCDYWDDWGAWNDPEPDPFDIDPDPYWDDDYYDLPPLD